MKRYLKLSEEAKKKWIAADNILEMLLELLNLDEPIKVGNKTYKLVSNFQDKNVAFKAVSFKMFDLKESKNVDTGSKDE